MEIHHPHHHGHKKKWTEYILEFFMLFFAVTLGFLAENTREHYVEKGREYELANSLYNEMKADSVDLEKVFAFRIKKEGYLNYLYLNYHGDVDNDSIQKLNQVAEYIGVSTNSATIFEPRNAIIHQLESSGMMRYFKNEELQTDLHNIINIAEQVKIRMQREFDIYQNFLMPVNIKYRNMDFERAFTLQDTSKVSNVKQIENYLHSDKYFKFPKNKISATDMEVMHRGYELYRFALSSGRRGQLLVYKNYNSKLLSDLRYYYHFQ